MDTFDYIAENPLMALVAFAPVLYLIIRDVASYFSQRKQLKGKLVIESKERITSLVSELNENREKFIQKLEDIGSQSVDQASESDDAKKPDKSDINPKKFGLDKETLIRFLKKKRVLKILRPLPMICFIMYLNDFAKICFNLNTILLIDDNLEKNG